MGPHYGDKIKSELFVALVTYGSVGWGILEASCGHFKGTSLWVCRVRECPFLGEGEGAWVMLEKNRGERAKALNSPGSLSQSLLQLGGWRWRLGGCSREMEGNRHKLTAGGYSAEVASLCAWFDATCFWTDFLGSVDDGKVPTSGYLLGVGWRGYQRVAGRVRDTRCSCLHCVSLLSGPCSHLNFVRFLCFGGTRGGGEGIRETQTHGPFGIWSSWSYKAPTAEGGRGQDLWV